MKTRISQLRVLAFQPGACERHAYDLRAVPVTECAYYRCITRETEVERREVYQRYVCAVRRHPDNLANDWGNSPSTSYEYLMELASELEQDNFVLRETPTVYSNGIWVKDGHHRLAILCAEKGEDFGTEVEVDEAAKLPDDVGWCPLDCPGRPA